MPLVAPAERWAVDPARAGARELRPGLWRLRLPLGWPEIPHGNAYAIARDGGGVVLVDCGMAGPGAWEGLERALGEAGLGVGDVRLLVGTHAHADHVGLAARLAEEAACEVWMHPATGHLYDIVREPRRLEAARVARALREGVPEALAAVYGTVEEEEGGVLAPREPDRPLLPGVRVDTALGPWEVVLTPGHCPSHVCLHQPEHGLLLAGDLLAPAFAPWFDYGFTADPVGEYLASLDAVDALGASLLLPGHGRPLEDPAAVIAAHRDGVRERLAATRAAVAAGEATGAEITLRVFGEPESELMGAWNVGETMGYLRHLRVTGAVERRTGSDGVFRHRAGRAVSVDATTIPRSSFRDAVVDGPARDA